MKLFEDLKWVWLELMVNSMGITLMAWSKIKRQRRGRRIIFFLSIRLEVVFWMWWTDTLVSPSLLFFRFSVSSFLACFVLRPPFLIPVCTCSIRWRRRKKGKLVLTWTGSGV